MRTPIRSLALAFGLCLAFIAPVSAASTPGPWTAHDTLRIQPDASPDAQSMLEELAWTPESFTIEAEPGNGDYHALLSFPSPQPNGDPINDRVVMEWYAPTDEAGQVVDGPAMLVLHILDGRMIVARIFARAFARQGIHAFVMHLPQYGLREPSGYQITVSNIIERARQGVADARRARDAIATLPHVRGDQIGIQGTSLGGFVSAVTASLDGAFDPVFITLAGGDLHGMFLNGQNEARMIRVMLEQEGYTGERLRELAWRLEPLRIAHRLNPNRTWIFSATLDQVVPPANARALAEAAQLDPSHHLWFGGDHISCAIHLPRIVTLMNRILATGSPVLMSTAP